METRTFNTIDVLEVWTGKRLPGFDQGFHGVMDFFYPGIMTIGCALMLGACQEQLAKQLPEEVKKITFDGMNEENAQQMLDEVMENLPKEIILTIHH